MSKVERKDKKSNLIVIESKSCLIQVRESGGTFHLFPPLSKNLMNSNDSNLSLNDFLTWIVFYSFLL
jgi:hypothetical protein